MNRDNNEAPAFSGPGFDELRGYLGAKAIDSSEAIAALDVAEKAEISAVLAAGGGIASRLAADRHVRGANFRSRTGPMFDDENQNRQTANDITDRIMARRREDPVYAAAIEFLTTTVIRSVDETSSQNASWKMNRIARGLKAIVAEVCAKPYEGRHADNG